MPALGKADGSIVIEALMDTGSAERGLKEIKSGANSLSASLKKIGGIIGTVFAAKSIVAFGKECVELGSNVAEVQNVVDVAFGDMVGKVEDFANSAIRNFGMSQLAAKKTASTYMAMAKGMNIPEEAAADMSITLAGLTGDIASFYNISQELADTKLKSVFTGETETLKDLGVVMTQANLKAYALNQGITKSIDSMTQAELVGLRYNFVVDQLALAQGDFARTSDSWANQTRILSMQWQELMSIIGQSLIQVLTPLVKVLNDVVASMITAAQTASTFVNALFGGSDKQMAATGSAASGVASEISESVDNQNALTDATKETEKAQKGLLAGFDEINKLSSDTSDNSAGITSGGGISSITPATQAVSVEVEGENKLSWIVDAFEKLRESLKPTTEALSELWDVLKWVGTFAGEALIDFYKHFLAPLASWSMGTGLPGFISAASDGLSKIDWSGINDSLRDFWDSLLPFATKIGEGLLWLWENVLVPFASYRISETIPRFMDILTSALDSLNAIIDIAAPALKWLWDKFLAPIEKFNAGMLLSFLDGLHGRFEILAGILTGDFSRAVSGAEEIVKSFGDRFGYAKDLAALFCGYIKQAFSSLPNLLKVKILDPVTRSFKLFINGLIGFVEGFVNFYIRGINTVINAANSLSFDVPDWVPLIGGETWGFDIQTLKELKLPRLATGAVIPPNREFLAVLGDQSSGTNIEAPLSTIEQALENVLNRRGNSGEQTAVMECDKIQFGKLIYKLGKSETARHGVSLTEVKG